MHSHNHTHTTPKKSNTLRNIFYLVIAIIILIGLYIHLQIPVLVIGGAITVILVHLAIVGGLAHLIPTLKKRFHREPAEGNSSEDAL